MLLAFAYRACGYAGTVPVLAKPSAFACLVSLCVGQAKEKVSA